MKKIIIFVLLLILSLTFSSCSSLNEDNDSNNYSIIIQDCQNGRIVCSKSTAKKGDVISLNVLCNIGYELENNTIYINEEANVGTSFEMPNNDVVISAKFSLTSDAKSFSTSCPISIKPTFSTSDNSLDIRATNNSGKTISAIKYYIFPYNAYGENIKRYGYSDECVFAIDDHTTLSGKSYTTFWRISGFSGVKTLKIYIASVYFEDGSEWGSRDAHANVVEVFAPCYDVKPIQ